jgi:hypothetical protein
MQARTAMAFSDVDYAAGRRNPKLQGEVKDFNHKLNRHCEKRSYEAIQCWRKQTLDCRASLAMTSFQNLELRLSWIKLKA